MSVTILKHKGKEIVFVDHQGLTGEKLIANMKEGSKVLLQRGKGNLSLTNFSDANLSNDAVEYVKSNEMREVVKCIEKDAFIGLGGIQKLVFNIYLKITGSKGKVFKTAEEAKDYLVS